jgi:hypothetical protein
MTEEINISKDVITQHFNVLTLVGRWANIGQPELIKDWKKCNFDPMSFLQTLTHETFPFFCEKTGLAQDEIHEKVRQACCVCELILQKDYARTEWFKNLHHTWGRFNGNFPRIISLINDDLRVPIIEWTCSSITEDEIKERVDNSRKPVFKIPTKSEPVKGQKNQPSQTSKQGGMFTNINQISALLGYQEPIMDKMPLSPRSSSSGGMVIRTKPAKNDLSAKFTDLGANSVKPMSHLLNIMGKR